MRSSGSPEPNILGRPRHFPESLKQDAGEFRLLGIAGGKYLFLAPDASTVIVAEAADFDVLRVSWHKRGLSVDLLKGLARSAVSSFVRVYAVGVLAAFVLGLVLLVFTFTAQPDPRPALYIVLLRVAIISLMWTTIPLVLLMKYAEERRSGSQAKSESPTLSSVSVDESRAN